jgi:protein-disulfide isomerase
MEDRTSRRSFLAVGGAAAVTALAGCSADESGTAGSEIDDGSRPGLGDEAAPVTVTVFEDFSCPHCQRFTLQTTPTIVQQYVEPGDVRYLHADFPIPVDDWSYPAANAGHAVFEEAGNDAFWRFLRSLFEAKIEEQRDYSLDVFEEIADEAADVGQAARTAASEGTYRERLDADRRRGENWGVRGTPTVFVDDEQVDLDGIGDAIERRL